MFFDLTWETLLGEHGYPVKPGMTLGLSPGLCLSLGPLLVTRAFACHPRLDRGSMASAAMDIRIRGHDNQVCHPRPDRGSIAPPPHLRLAVAVDAPDLPLLAQVV